MSIVSIPRLVLAATALALALGLAACNKSSDNSGTTTSGEKVAPVAPPAGKAWADVVSTTADGGYLMGNPKAPIKLVEYGSLSCPHCAHFAQESAQELTDNFVNSGRVSYEFRSFAIHPQDVPLTMLVRCGTTETFFPLVEQIYQNFDAMNAPLADKGVQAKANAATSLPPQQRLVALADALGYTQFFASRGISVDQAHACLGKLDQATQIANFSQKYSNDGINGTPTLIVNGTKVDSTEWAATKQALIAAGAS